MRASVGRATGRQRHVPWLRQPRHPAILVEALFFLTVVERARRRYRRRGIAIERRGCKENGSVPLTNWRRMSAAESRPGETRQLAVGGVPSLATVVLGRGRGLLRGGVSGWALPSWSVRCSCLDLVGGRVINCCGSIAGNATLGPTIPWRGATFVVQSQPE